MQQLIGRVILQRKKCELNQLQALNLTSKVEVVVWVPLSSSQRQLYEKYLANRHVQLTLQSAQVGLVVSSAYCDFDLTRPHHTPLSYSLLHTLS